MRVQTLLIVAGLMGSAAQTRQNSGGPTYRSPPRVPGTPPVVTFTAREYAFDGPDSIESGPTTIRLVSAGREQHFLGLVKLADAHTLADYSHVLSWKVLPPWVIAVGGVGTIAPGGTATTTLDLEPGHYAMVCDIEDAHGTAHMREGMLRLLTVSPRTNGAVMPTPDVKVTLTEFAFMAPEKLPAGFHVVDVYNAGSLPHMALVWRLLSTTSASAVIHWLDTPSDTSQPVALVGGVPDLAPGRGAQLRLSLPPGRYLIICLVGDSPKSKAHYDMGMVREFTVVPRAQ